MEICPIDRPWVHTFLLEPALQGVGLINQAWTGVPFNPLNKTPISLKNRIISFIVGAFLLIPVVNLIIWIAWQTFGNPERLFDDYCPKEALSPLVRNKRLAPLDRPASITSVAEEGPPPQLFSYNETNGDARIKTEWKVKRYPEETVAEQSCYDYRSASVYAPNGTLKTYNHVSQEGDLFVELMNPKELRVQITKPDTDPTDTILKKEADIPWIQQPTLGFKNFILSDQKEMPFYGVLFKNPVVFPRPPFLIKGIAKKVGEEELPGFGKQIKVEVTPDPWFLRSFKAEFWFDPPTGPSPGMLRKFVDSGILNKQIGEYAL